MENSDVGEHEDVDVKNERQKVFNIIAGTAEPPVVLVQVKMIKIKFKFSSVFETLICLF